MYDMVFLEDDVENNGKYDTTAENHRHVIYSK